MLGIMLSDFNAEIAKSMGLPVSSGVRIDGTVPGMGAEAAGLQSGDVIVGMAGYPVGDFSSLTHASRLIRR
jgi:S1-C subfamily serine protease